MTAAVDPRRSLARPDVAAAIDPSPAEVICGLAPLLPAPDAAGLAAELRLGERVRVAETRGDLVRLQRVRDRYVGWAPVAALGPVGAPPTHRVAAPLAHIYLAPDIKTRPRDIAPMGALLAGTPEGAFLRTQHGFVPLAALVPAALSLLGAPYLWGGESALGVDCSGLVQLSHPGAPRDSDMQAAEVGAPLPNPWTDPDLGAPADLRRGDLIFWRGHVGMLLDADTLLHANATHMRVTQEPLAPAIVRIAASATAAGTGAGLPTALRRP
jgi:hypothetical protein